jgi:hypothetical protein
MHLSP